MRTRGVVSLLTVIGLVGSQCLAENARPFGVLMDTQNATLRNTAVVEGTTVFPGDVIATRRDGAARVAMHGSQFYLAGDSEAQLRESGGAAEATVLRGSVGFVASGTAAMRLATPDFFIRPVTNQSTHGRITVVGPNELRIESFEGPIELVQGDMTRLLAAGTAYRVMLASADAQEPQGAGRRRGVRPIVLIVILGVAATAVGILIWRTVRSTPVSPLVP